MNGLVELLVGKFNYNVVFTVPLFGGVGVMEPVAVTWATMIIMIIASLTLVYGLKVRNINKKQAALESGTPFICDSSEGLLGKEGKVYIPYLIMVVIYIGTVNMIGLFSLESLTEDLNVTVPLATTSIVLTKVAGICRKGVRGWIKNFVKPIAIVALISVLELFIRPLFPRMWLLGNALGAIVVMAFAKHLLSLAVPLLFSLYFDMFGRVIQAHIFVFPTSPYIKETIEG